MADAAEQGESAGQKQDHQQCANNHQRLARRRRRLLRRLLNARRLVLRAFLYLLDLLVALRLRTVSVMLLILVLALTFGLLILLRLGRPHVIALVAALRILRCFRLVFLNHARSTWVGSKSRIRLIVLCTIASSSSAASLRELSAWRMISTFSCTIPLSLAPAVEDGKYAGHKE